MNSPLPKIIGYGLGECAYSLVLNGLFWLGNGIVLPSCTAMVADVAGLWLRRTGVVWCLGCGTGVTVPSIPGHQVSSFEFQFSSIPMDFLFPNIFLTPNLWTIGTLSV